jgi:hypothetical protein
MDSCRGYDSSKKAHCFSGDIKSAKLYWGIIGGALQINWLLEE